MPYKTTMLIRMIRWGQYLTREIAAAVINLMSRSEML